MAKRKEILVPHGTVKKLKISTGFSEPTVRYALKGYIDSDKAMLIRKRALEMGGAEVK